MAIPRTIKALLCSGTDVMMNHSSAGLASRLCAFWLAAFSPSLAACATPSSYRGVDLAVAPQSAERVEVEMLSLSSPLPDKRVRPGPNIRYKGVRGVALELGRAAAFHSEAAAATAGGTLLVYLPNAKAQGGIVPVGSGPRLAGLGGAKSRLNRVTARASRRPISGVVFGADGREPNSARKESLVTNIGWVARLSQDGSDLDDLPLLRAPEEGSVLLRACRSKPELDITAFAVADPFDYGYCQAYIMSKLFRLSSEKKSELEVRRKRAQGEIFSTWIVIDILEILRSPGFERAIVEFRGGLKEPFTAEKLLDYVINEKLYSQPR